MVAWFFYWKRRSKMRRSFIAAGVILSLLVVISLQSYADDVIHGCIHKTNGKLRVVGSPNECKQTEIAIYWNKVGPQGEQGEPGTDGIDGMDGINCWDLNGNRQCDLSTEDKNNDDICDASDCQGTSDTGAIWVYDANDNRIGRYVTGSLVYIPELDAVTEIEPNIPGGPYIGDNWYGNFHTARFNFNNEDFTALYIHWSSISPPGGSNKMLIRDACGAEDKYYISKTEIVSIYQVYYRDGGNEDCTIKLEGTPGWYNNYELEPIQITDIPFPVPIIGPLRYQFAP